MGAKTMPNVPRGTFPKRETHELKVVTSGNKPAMVGNQPIAEVGRDQENVGKNRACALSIQETDSSLQFTLAWNE